jgi:hypothetical protein
LYAAALDPRIRATCVSGYFDDRRDVWRQPIDRNVFGLVDQFGDAELASMVAPQALIVEAAQGPELALPSQGGAPARLETPELRRVRREVERARTLTAGLKPTPTIKLVVSQAGAGPHASREALGEFVHALAPGAHIGPARSRPVPEQGAASAKR